MTYSTPLTLGLTSLSNIQINIKIEIYAIFMLYFSIKSESYKLCKQLWKWFMWNRIKRKELKKEQNTIYFTTSSFLLILTYIVSQTSEIKSMYSAKLHITGLNIRCKGMRVKKTRSSPLQSKDQLKQQSTKFWTQQKSSVGKQCHITSVENFLVFSCLGAVPERKKWIVICEYLHILRFILLAFGYASFT